MNGKKTASIFDKCRHKRALFDWQSDMYVLSTFQFFSIRNIWLISSTFVINPFFRFRCSSWPQSGTENGQSNSAYGSGFSASSQSVNVITPQTPSPVEQMVANPSTYRMRKNTAPSVVNSINNQSGEVSNL